MKINSFIDLHLHLDGSLSLETVKKLAGMQGMALPSDEEVKKKMQADKACRNLTEYLKCFDYALSFLQTEEAIEESVFLLLKECQELGMCYGEIRFAPQLHLQKGLTQKQVTEAALRGRRRSGVPSGLILCCMRMANNQDANLETVRLAKEYQKDGICAVDMAGDELHFPILDYKKEFALARKLGVPITIHAGEADGADSVRNEVSLGAVRIGHGVRSVEDEALMKELAEKGIVLELCPTSNLQTKVFECISDYPIRRFFDAGIKVTVNSDNMTVSGTNAKAETELFKKACLISEEEEQMLFRNSIEAAFLSAAEKEALWKNRS